MHSGLTGVQCAMTATRGAMAKLLLNFPLFNQFNVCNSITRHLKKNATRGFRISASQIEAEASPNMVRIRRDGSLMDIGFDWAAQRNTEVVLKSRMRVSAFLSAQCAAPSFEATFALDDGQLPNQALFAPSTNKPATVGVPDEFFMTRSGFAAMRALAEESALPWQARSRRLRWRGAPNGEGRLDVSTGACFDPTVLPRLRMVMIAAALPDCDVKLTPRNWFVSHEGSLRPFGVNANPIPEPEWLADRYALDIDGFTNTWTNLLIRLHFGCCVLKVESQFGFRQWYYDDLRPWEHYVPVKSDMSDLGDKLEWARSHDSEAEAIAMRGRQLARSMTLESETKRAGRIIETALGL
jgi:hypothetical protein